MLGLSPGMEAHVTLWSYLHRQQWRVIVVAHCSTLTQTYFFLDINQCNEHHLLCTNALRMPTYHRIIEWPGLKRTTVIISFQPPAMCRVANHQTRLPRALNAPREASGAHAVVRCCIPQSPASRLPASQLCMRTNLLSWPGFIQLHISCFLLITIDLAMPFLRGCYQQQACRRERRERAALWHAPCCISNFYFALFTSRNTATVVRI